MLEPIPVPGQSRCPSCGHENRAAKFCDQCGTRLPLNPYAAPASEAEEPRVTTGAAQLASRGARMGAAILDAIAVAIVNLPLLLGAGVWPVSPNAGPVELIPVVAISFIGFALVQSWFLARGQTVGKLLLGLRIVDVESGEPPSVPHLLGLRYLPSSALVVLGPIGSLLALLDVLLIFGKERRCLHDWIASTRVVWVDARRR